MTSHGKGTAHPIEWDSNLSVGLRALDSEHVAIINMLNYIGSYVGKSNQYSIIDRCMRDLYAYTANHFEHEEELMSEYGYPDIDDHVESHSIFIKKLREMDRELSNGSTTSNDLIQRLVILFVSHIREDDKRMGFFVAQRISPDITPFEFEPDR